MAKKESKSGRKTKKASVKDANPARGSMNKTSAASAKKLSKKKGAAQKKSGPKRIDAGTPREHSNDLSELGAEGMVHPSAWIHPKATVIGNVVLGPECSIWPSSVIRADLGHITLGKAVNIQDGSVIHCDSRGRVEIGDYTLVGHRAMLHGCKVGKAALIGIDCVILDGAEIGDGAMITAGCMIRGGMKIPPRSMVVQKGGELKIFPNKARTQLTIGGSLEYVELARRWKERIFTPPTEEEDRALFERAGAIFKEMFSE